MVYASYYVGYVYCSSKFGGDDTVYRSEVEGVVWLLEWCPGEFFLCAGGPGRRVYWTHVIYNAVVVCCSLEGVFEPVPGVGVVVTVFCGYAHHACGYCAVAEEASLVVGYHVVYCGPFADGHCWADTDGEVCGVVAIGEAENLHASECGCSVIRHGDLVCPVRHVTRILT